MKYYFTTKVKLVLIVAALLAAGLAIIGNLTGKTPGDMLVQGVLTPLRNGVSSITAQAEQFYNYMFRYEALEAENAALKEQLAQYREDAGKSDSLEREIQRLKILLELKAQEESFQLVDSYIISWNSNDWSKSFTINRGSAHGIQEGMCAITETKAVVGLVTEVGPNYAVVKSVLDSSLEISATIASSGYSGMVQGGYSTEQEGMLRMDYIPSSAVIRNKDQVVTAGSTVYPRNLIIGQVVDADFDETGVAKYAILEPAVDIDALEQVFILTDFSLG
ncbi:MAG: rod shape-determining protein MreC [Oscillospiraceae bacterium]|nr:rod shape-determining protein MreC [Oscillospiraceae bacterium]